MTIPNLKDLVLGEKFVRFIHYTNNELWYQHQDGFQFPVPISDTGNGVFMALERASLYMRWMRKHIEMLKSAIKEADVSHG